jgi:hypothetical protein
VWDVTLVAHESQPLPTTTSVLNVTGELLALDDEALTMKLQLFNWDFPAARGSSTPPAKKRCAIDFANLRPKKKVVKDV